MRILEKTSGKQISLDAATLKDLGEWCQQSRLRSDAARDAIERALMEDMRQYAGVPLHASRNDPIEDAPNVEITLGAVAVDGIYANFVELVTQTSQFVTAIPRKNFEDYADAVQDFIDWGCREAFNVEQAINVGPFECVQLGTMSYYIPYVEKIRVTDEYKIIDRGPRIMPLVFEDFHLPEGSQGDVQTDPWVEMDIWVQGGNDLRLRAKQGKWKYAATAEGGDVTAKCQRAANIPELTQRRYDVARDQSSQASQGDLFHLGYRCAEYDIDDDGINEEIEILRDCVSGNILDVRYPYYQTRPFETAVYQIRPRVAWGLGVQRMCYSFEEEVSEIHNERVLNMRLANARIWKATRTIAPFLARLWTGKVVEVSTKDDFSGEKMADVYPSSTQSEMMTIAFAERRTGVSDLNSAGQRIGTRTPGVSAMSYLQAANRRFTPPFRNMRNCIGAAIRQCLYRVQERIRRKDKAAIEDVMNVLGDQKGAKFVELCEKVDNLIDAFDVQVTAASISVNREADRQNFLMLMNMWQSWQKQRIELAQFATMAPTPDLKQLAEAIDKAGLKLMRRFLRTFETISDVDSYLAEVRGAEELMGQLPPELQQGLMGLTEQMGGSMVPFSSAGGPQGPNGGPPPDQVPQAA